ncbi:peptidyl-prolyl cis-trans isomerase-like [Chelonus insularis]|uniref:peptidyl-prolyl cis-trans isomerase-like n=1 Tax=Chelonus insularis TaxID=460826 RepID=UPI00158A1656|nr:peptidyl-prolyl cis-trans isomerase-like [Chelonus insularis]
MDKIHNVTLLEDEVKRVLQIDRENRELLQRLNQIYRSKAKTDCWNTQIYEVSDRDKDGKKRNEERIIRENKELYQHLQQIRYGKPEMDSKNKINKKLNKKNLIKNILTTNRPKCYFDLKVVETQQSLGKIVMELYADILPKTCKNFLSFCEGYHGKSYKNTPFHRIIRGYLCQGGDVTNFNGSGGTSIYGDSFEDENFHFKHTTCGILSMSNSGKNTNDSKFNLTFKKLEILDRKNVVFGAVIYGLNNLMKIEYFGTTTGKPKNQVIISKCGLY